VNRFERDKKSSRVSYLNGRIFSGAVFSTWAMVSIKKRTTLASGPKKINLIKYYHIVSFKSNN